jgi:hypothetical protein
MSFSPTFKILTAAVLLLGLGACATTEKWSAAGGSRENGVVRVSYQYPEYQQPELSDAEAGELALSRCNAWGYREAQPIAGRIRQCANMDAGNCDLWSVTREYQCTNGDSGYAAARLSR